MTDVSSTANPRVHAIGGSNSLKRGGYVDALGPILGRKIHNASIGASSSLMGLYRAVCDMQLNPGDTVIWEYALNDLNHISQKGYKAEDLLAYTEHTLRHLRVQGVRVLPLILHPAEQVWSDEHSDYLENLDALFAHYGLAPFETVPFLTERFGFAMVAHNLFADKAHYRINTLFMDVLVHAIAQRLDDAAKPADIEPMFVDTTATLAFEKRFEGGLEKEVTNNFVSVTGYTPNPKMRMMSPVDGSLIALSVMAGRNGGGIQVRSGGRTARLSLTHAEAKFDKRLFKVINLRHALKTPVTVQKGKPVRFEWSSEPGWHAADFGFQAQLSKERLKGREGMVVAALFEAP